MFRLRGKTTESIHGEGPVTTDWSPSSRVWIIAAVLATECVLIGVTRHPWCKPHKYISAGIVFCCALLFFGRERLRTISWNESSISVRFAVLLHGCGLALVTGAQVYLLYYASPGTRLGQVAVGLWCCGAAILPLSLAASLFSLHNLLLLPARLGRAWAYASLCTLPAIFAGSVSQFCWDAPKSQVAPVLQAATFHGVHAILSLFYTGVISEPKTHLIGTSGFQVIVAGACSGIEGIALMLVVTVGWIFYLRRELRLVRALLLVPVALGVVWVLNLVRIASLIAIGDAGHEAVAMGGFHSEAGWILFNSVAIGFLLAANQVTWLRKTVPSGVEAPVGAQNTINMTAVYVLPFLAVLATSLISNAASSGFEWLYPLRLVAALAVLWAYRREYRKLDWSFGWLGVLAGAVVFAAWLGLDRSSHGGVASTALATGLARLTTSERLSWIVARVAAAVVTVPIVEELAFRGFLARRLISPNFEDVRFRSIGWMAVLVSSAVFGLMHGKMWLAGILAGVIFVLVARLRNRIGEAVAAHATANLLIAIWVLTRGDYRLW